ncbi:Uncharacterised protein [Mycobacteroides abscessus subsp. massiliense]|uniref:Uncharacterized protein n=1 Tax=Mycobacteroides abscessus subsp. massiliense TaxID=1962118 RepID=A0A1T8VEY3_9MYCO|nr:Uncharacterised protein [Mycobacteroides abscessus subsp. massiliense]
MRIVYSTIGSNSSTFCSTSIASAATTGSAIFWCNIHEASASVGPSGTSAILNNDLAGSVIPGWIAISVNGRLSSAPTERNRLASLRRLMFSTNRCRRRMSQSTAAGSKALSTPSWYPAPRGRMACSTPGNQFFIASGSRK